MFHNIIHEHYMKDILTAIFDNEIGKFLAFKGGTLAYWTYNLDRFSTDIDVDLLDHTREQFIIQKIRERLVMLGEIKNETLGKTIDRRIFRYDETSMNIKIEVNKRIWAHNTYNVQTIQGIKLLCMTPACMFANKLVALSERLYSRDLYDVYFFFHKKFPIQESLIQERTGLSTRVFFTKLLAILPQYFTRANILTGLGEVVSTKQKSWIKLHLLQETLAYIQQFLDQMTH